MDNINLCGGAGRVWRDFLATLEGLENEAISNLNLNSLGDGFCLETARKGAGYMELMNIIADVSELQPISGRKLKPVDIIHWKRTESEACISYGWPGKYGYWDSWVNVYSAMSRNEIVKNEHRDAGYLKSLREGEALSKTFFLPSQPWVSTTPVILSKAPNGDKYVLIHCECVPSEVDALHGLNPTDAARDKMRQLIKWMLQIIWASGHCRDLPVIAIAGMYNEMAGMVGYEKFEYVIEPGTGTDERLRTNV